MALPRETISRGARARRVHSGKGKSLGKIWGYRRSADDRAPSSIGTLIGSVTVVRSPDSRSVRATEHLTLLVVVSAGTMSLV
jgi:hypothetical protein